MLPFGSIQICPGKAGHREVAILKDRGVNRCKPKHTTFLLLRIVKTAIAKLAIGDADATKIGLAKGAIDKTTVFDHVTLEVNLLKMTISED